MHSLQIKHQINHNGKNQFVKLAFYRIYISSDKSKQLINPRSDQHSFVLLQKKNHTPWSNATLPRVQNPAYPPRQLREDTQLKAPALFLQTLLLPEAECLNTSSDSSQMYILLVHLRQKTTKCDFETETEQVHPSSPLLHSYYFLKTLVKKTTLILHL